MKQTQGNKSPLNDKLLKYFLKKETKCCRIDKINRLKNSDLLILLPNAIEPICTTTSRKRPPIRKNKKLGVSPMKEVRLGRTIAFYQVFFQQGSVALGKCYIGLQNGHAPQDSRDGFFLYSARLLRRACSRSFWIISFEFVKVCGIRFSIWEIVLNSIRNVKLIKMRKLTRMFFTAVCVSFVFSKFSDEHPGPRHL